MAMAIARNIRKFSVSKFNSSRSISSRTRTEADQVRPRWLGQDLSEVPDSGIGRTQDIRTCRNGVGWCDQNTFQPTIPQPIRRKRRAGDRVAMGSDVGRDVGREGALWGTPRKRAFSVRKGKIVSPLGVMWWRSGRGDLRITSIQRWPSPGGHLRVSRGGPISESRTG